MVDHKEASQQTLPELAARSFDPGFWTRTLGRLGLESPGYQETLSEMRNKDGENKKAKKTKKKK